MSSWGKIGSADAKLAGRAEEILDADERLRIFRSRGSDPPTPDAQLFRAAISERWHEGRGLLRG